MCMHMASTFISFSARGHAATLKLTFYIPIIQLAIRDMHMRRVVCSRYFETPVCFFFSSSFSSSSSFTSSISSHILTRLLIHLLVRLLACSPILSRSLVVLEYHFFISISKINTNNIVVVVVVVAVNMFCVRVFPSEHTHRVYHTFLFSVRLRK